MITKDNYEAFFLDFLEGNLSEKDKKELEVFLKKNPQLEKELKAYDGNLFLKADLDVRFEEKESLKRKKAAIFPLWARYSSVAAVFLLLITISFELFHTEDLKTNSTISSPIVQAMKKSVVENKEIKTEKAENSKQISHYRRVNKPKAIAKTETKEATKDTILETEPKIILSNSMVVYEVDNLIAYKQDEEWDEKDIIEVNNLIAYKDSPAINPLLSPLINNKYVYQLRNNIEDKIEKTQDGFNNALAYIQDNIKFNPFEISITKK